MIRFTAFKVLFALLITTTSFAQHKLSGTVLTKQDNGPVKGCTVYLNNGNRTAETDSAGRFLFADLPNGPYVLQTTCPDFKSAKQPVSLSGADQSVTILLTTRTETLNEVTVTDKQSGFGFTRMRGVENMGIYEGKKSEVIIPDQLTANLSTNNVRQIYARVAGLNIWENEGAGLQLSIGGRGLDPNRSSNFNVRQNGYDISADALGYPESYYTPPIEAVGRIQVVRGARLRCNMARSLAACSTL